MSQPVRGSLSPSRTAFFAKASERALARIFGACRCFFRHGGIDLFTQAGRSGSDERYPRVIPARRFVQAARLRAGRTCRCICSATRATIRSGTAFASVATVFLLRPSTWGSYGAGHALYCRPRRMGTSATAAGRAESELFASLPESASPSAKLARSSRSTRHSSGFLPARHGGGRVRWRISLRYGGRGLRGGGARSRRTWSRA
jgi:hypothetical protein